MSRCLLSFFLDRCCYPGNQAKSTLHDCQHRPLRACRPVEDRIRSLPMTETSGVWAKRICRTVIGKRSKAKSVLGGGFFLFGTFSFWPRRKKKYIRRCKRHVYHNKMNIFFSIFYLFHGWIGSYVTMITYLLFFAMIKRIRF